MLRMRTSGPRSVGRVPSHADVLAQAEEIAGGLSEEHLGVIGRKPDGPGACVATARKSEVGGFEYGGEGDFLNGCVLLNVLLKARLAPTGSGSVASVSLDGRAGKG